MGIEQRFNAPFIAGMALEEKQIQQNDRLIIALLGWGNSVQGFNPKDPLHRSAGRSRHQDSENMAGKELAGFPASGRHRGWQCGRGGARAREIWPLPLQGKASQ
ncbi:MAG: hypothetical protein TH68_02130 [Candidatus Synechococcus spongiarum 142]|uniref:Uncharacterized protein n=1 Tax=Candidatus Synechococcus spongiarum 142 TaxID=1608213 RepID=A0A6N3XC22_9SYNE|nr:MAG: hypothetical protein TH68_02130 [Candidatus Synechococcus spongiarum 142]